MSNFTDILTGSINVTRLAMSTISSLGSPVNTKTTVYTAIPARFYTKKGKIYMKPVGNQDEVEHWVMVGPDKDVRNLDIVDVVSGVCGTTCGTVDFLEHIMDFAGVTHHLEFRMV